ncbi:hypothetical protein HUJ05_007236 [Dendroctonus ponderosae]|nr:hypothetical protein HUJ05_007236 [Dendroctonus ponderosae]
MGLRIKCRKYMVTLQWIFSCTMIAVGLIFVLALATLGNCQNEQLTLEECFDKYERGIYPHPDDCTKFLSCATTDPLDCPAGLHFNPGEFVCDWPANAGCMKVTTPTPDQTDSPTPESLASEPEAQKTATSESPDQSPTTPTPQLSTTATTPTSPTPSEPEQSSEASQTTPSSSTASEPAESSAPTEATPQQEISSQSPETTPKSSTAPEAEESSSPTETTPKSPSSADVETSSQPPKTTPSEASETPPSSATEATPTPVSQLPETSPEASVSTGQSPEPTPSSPIPSETSPNPSTSPALETSPKPSVPSEAQSSAPLETPAVSEPLRSGSSEVTPQASEATTPSPRGESGLPPESCEPSSTHCGQPTEVSTATPNPAGPEKTNEPPPSEPGADGDSECLPDAPKGAACSPPTSPQEPTQSPPCGEQNQPCPEPTKAPKCDSALGACPPQNKPQLERNTQKPPTLGSRFKETTSGPDDREPLSEPPPPAPGTYNVKDCVARHKFGMYAHPTDPSKFYMCSKSKLLQMSCREGLEFDPAAFGCNRPKSTPPPPPPELNLHECLTQYKRGLFPHRADCSRFFACSRRGPIEMVCPGGLHFNPIKLVCDWPSKFCVSPGAKTRDKIFQAMKSDKIAPDVVDRCPEKLAEVAFPSGGQVDLGKELTPSQTLTPPSIYWEADKKSLYTLCMVDPDAPRTKESNKPNQWNHWTVGNIPGNQIARGQPLVEYLPPCPAKNSPPHRYTYMVYKQPARINFKEPRVAANSFQHRDGFSLRSFAQKYQLGNPIAGNFFKCRWDRSVPMIFQRLQVQPPPFRMVIRPGVSQSNVHSYSYSFSFRN